MCRLLLSNDYDNEFSILTSFCQDKGREMAKNIALLALRHLTTLAIHVNPLLVEADIRTFVSVRWEWRHMINGSLILHQFKYSNSEHRGLPHAFCLHFPLANHEPLDFSYTWNLGHA